MDAGLLQHSFTAADWFLISAIALVCTGAMRRYSQVFVAVIIAVLADLLLPGAYALITGGSAGNALADSWVRLAGDNGLALLVRVLIYFGAISILFGIKTASGRP